MAGASVEMLIDVGDTGPSCSPRRFDRRFRPRGSATGFSERTLASPACERSCDRGYSLSFVASSGGDVVAVSRQMSVGGTPNPGIVTEVQRWWPGPGRLFAGSTHGVIMIETVCDYGNHTFCIDDCACSCHEEDARDAASAGTATG